MKPSEQAKQFYLKFDMALDKEGIKSPPKEVALALEFLYDDELALAREAQNVIKALRPFLDGYFDHKSDKEMDVMAWEIEKALKAYDKLEQK